MSFKGASPTSLYQVQQGRAPDAALGTSRALRKEALSLVRCALAERTGIVLPRRKSVSRLIHPVLSHTHIRVSSFFSVRVFFLIEVCYRRGVVVGEGACRLVLRLEKKIYKRISELVVLAADSSLFRAVVSSGCVYGLSCGACAIPLEALSLQQEHATREWGVQQCTERGVQSGA